MRELAVVCKRLPMASLATRIRPSGSMRKMASGEALMMVWKTASLVDDCRRIMRSPGLAFTRRVSGGLFAEQSHFFQTLTIQSVKKRNEACGWLGKGWNLGPETMTVTGSCDKTILLVACFRERTQGLAWDQIMPHSMSAQPTRAWVVRSSPRSIQPATAAKTASRLRMMAAGAGRASRWATTCRV